MSNPPPMAKQFLIDLRKMIGIAKQRISMRRHIPHLSIIPEEEEEIATKITNCAQQILKKFDQQNFYSMRDKDIKKKLFKIYLEQNSEKQEEFICRTSSPSFNQFHTNPFINEENEEKNVDIDAEPVKLENNNTENGSPKSSKSGDSGRETLADSETESSGGSASGSITPPRSSIKTLTELRHTCKSSEKEVSQLVRDFANVNPSLTSISSATSKSLSWLKPSTLSKISTIKQQETSPKPILASVSRIPISKSPKLSPKSIPLTLSPNSNNFVLNDSLCSLMKPSHLPPIPSFSPPPLPPRNSSPLPASLKTTSIPAFVQKSPQNLARRLQHQPTPADVKQNAFYFAAETDLMLKKSLPRRSKN